MLLCEQHRVTAQTLCREMVNAFGGRRTRRIPAEVGSTTLTWHSTSETEQVLLGQDLVSSVLLHVKQSQDGVGWKGP